MSLATIDRPRTQKHAFPAQAPTATQASALTSVGTTALAPAPAPVEAPAAPAVKIRAVPDGTEARGFVLYVGLDEAKAAAAGTDLGSIVAQPKQFAATLVPDSETYAAVALAPEGSGGRDLDVVRLALQEPAALARHRQVPEEEPEVRGGVIVDLSRKRL